MTFMPVVADTGDETLTVADIEEDMGRNPDMTGDYAAGRVYSFASGEEFVDWMDSLRHGPAND